MTPLERVTALALANGDPEDPATRRPLLSLEEFFDGNDVVGSIGCNLYPEQPPEVIFQHLKTIRDREDVADVLVEITMFDDPDWPFSERVWVITGASPEEVLSWFDESVAPSDTWIEWSEDVDHSKVVVPQGMQPVICWWD